MMSGEPIKMRIIGPHVPASRGIKVHPNTLPNTRQQQQQITTTLSYQMPRTALTETSASKLNKRTATDLDDSEPQPSKKPKKADSSEKLSASNPPEFLSHVTLDGEEAVSIYLSSFNHSISFSIAN